MKYEKKVPSSCHPLFRFSPLAELSLFHSVSMSCSEEGEVEKDEGVEGEEEIKEDVSIDWCSFK